ncbi:piggyBac transposable element-derived protein 2-like, partial [Palaemon carinicauda]|uniref:piggyBac transposable element-derived protein 2-like n=1 Tax=Palaemon carinicauda TaxID=392227 RepID=UPI0035B67D1B
TLKAASLCSVVTLKRSAAVFCPKHWLPVKTILEENDSQAKVYFERTNTGLLTDEDSADEDGSGLTDNLSGRQLTGDAEAVFHDERRTTEDDCEPQLSGNDEAISHDERCTAEDDGAAHNFSPINSYKTPKWSLGTSLTPGECMFPEANYAKYRDFTPTELFKLFFDDDMWNMLLDHNIIYATLKGETDFLVTKDEMKVFIGILIVSGIVPVSSRRMFWRKSSVTRNEVVYQAMRRFEKIMQFISFSDNSKLDTTEKYAKVRPLVRHLTKKFIEHFQLVKSLYRDEAMVEYYGKHGCKQCIRMKPISFGYKVWCLNSHDGYLVTFDLYQGRTYEGNEVNGKVFGKCAATVLKNIDSLSEEKRLLPYNIYIDNLFTPFQLLTELKDRNYGSTGT